MPKIGIRSKSFEIDYVKHDIDFEVHYSSELKFFAVLPKEYREKVDLLTDQEKKDFAIRMERGGKSTWSQNGKPVVISETEAGAIDLMVKLLNHFISATSKRREVILVWFSQETEKGNYYNYNEQHRKIGATIGLFYCTEISSGNVFKYWKLEKSQFNWMGSGENRETRSAVTWYGDGPLILEDTPENRSKAEALYLAMKTLSERLKDLTSSGEKLLEYIQPNLKLIG